MPVRRERGRRRATAEHLQAVTSELTTTQRALLDGGRARGGDGRSRSVECRVHSAVDPDVGTIDESAHGTGEEDDRRERGGKRGAEAGSRWTSSACDWTHLQHLSSLS